VTTDGEMNEDINNRYMENELDFQPEDDGQMNLGQINAIKRQREKKALMNQEYIGKLESTFNKKMNNPEQHRVK
jgi:hypothetical protein